MKQTLSASKIKVLKSCSWQYWCKYHLKLPDKTNDGALKGEIVHLVFECLGNKRHEKHFNKILKKGVLSSKAVKRLILKHIKIKKLNKEEHIDDICDMIQKGLLYDFFGNKYGKPSSTISEKDFELDICEGDISYKIKGFIDRIFIYEDKSVIIIRDFKTNKKKYEGKEIEDNLQDNIYTLAIKKLFPEFSNIQMEFLFLKQNSEEEMVLKMKEKSSSELGGFEYELTAYQKYADSFDEKIAVSNLAVDQGMPTDGSFSGKLLCGFATKPNEKKKDGSPKWYCSFKFAFDYYSVIDKNGVVKKSFFTKEEIDLKSFDPTDTIKKNKYSGCPRFQPRKADFDDFDLDNF